MTKAKVEGTAQAWESETLGLSEEHAVLSDLGIADLDEALSLQMISIRLPKELIEDYKFLAERLSIGYQPLMKQVLKRFADCELKQIARETMRADHEKNRQAKAAKKAVPPRKRA